MALVNFLKIGSDGLQAEHDPSADSLNLVDLEFGGTSVGGTAGATVLGDDKSVYTNFSPATDDIRATLLAIDIAIGVVTSGDKATYTNDNAGTISLGQAVYVSSADSVDLAKNDDTAKDDPIGLVCDATILTTADGQIQTDGLALGVLSGATANDKYFLDSTAGDLTASVPGSGKKVFLMGFAKNATDLQMRMQDIGIKA